MTEEELQEILDNEELEKKLDIRTLVLDFYMKYATMDEIIEIFKEKMPLLDESYVKRFIYMKRN